MLRRRHEGRALVLTVDRPEVKNAIGRELALALIAALDDAGRDAALAAVVLAAEGGVFLSGGDLREIGALPLDGRGADAVLAMGALPLAIERCALPVIAAVGGPALGGGAELVLACDVVVMSPAASLRFVHAKMGLTPAWGGATRLAEKVGAGAAAELLLSARAIDAEQAFARGLCQRLVDDARVGALALAAEIAAHREAAVLLKQSLGAARDARRGDAFAAEQEVFRRAWGSPAHQAALAAFAGKRGQK